MIVSFKLFSFHFKIVNYFRRRTNLRNERCWMYKRSCKGVYNIRFLEGIKELIPFGKKNSSKFEIRWLCEWCDNCRLRSPKVVRDHVLQKEFIENYYDLYLHYHSEVGPSNVVVREEL